MNLHTLEYFRYGNSVPWKYVLPILWSQKNICVNFSLLACCSIVHISYSMTVSHYCLDSPPNRGGTMQVYTDCKRRLLLTFDGVQKALLCRARSAGRRCAAVHMPRHRKWYSRKYQLTLAYVLSISYFLIDLFCFFVLWGGGGGGFTLIQ